MRTIERRQVGPGSTRLVLPPRRLPLPIRSFARAMAVVGSLLWLMALAPLLGGGSLQLTHYAAAAAGIAPLAVGILLLYGQSAVDCGPTVLVFREQAGPLLWRRTVRLMALEAVQVEALPLPLVGRDGEKADPVMILAAAVRGRGRRVLLFGHPAAVLAEVGKELRRRAGLATELHKPQ